MLTDGTSGILLLDPDRTELLRVLDRVFLTLLPDAQDDVPELSLPPMYPLETLSNFDVYRNFPHLEFVASALDDPHDFMQSGRSVPSAEDPGTPRFGLSHATCFGVYAYLHGQTVAPNDAFTAINSCFRHENHYDGLKRLAVFRMREIVSVGAAANVIARLDRLCDAVRSLLTELAIPFSLEYASDPFFEADGPRALLAKIDPVKREFLVEGLAVSSANIHRNFFAERSSIKTSDGNYADTSCFAFGMERWIFILEQRFGDAITASKTLASFVR